MLPAYRLHERALRRYVPKVFPAETLERYIGWMRSREGRRWLVHFFRYYEVQPRPELAAGLEKLSQPTAVIWGERDPFCPDGIGRDLAKRIPGASLTLIPTAGHFVMEESPELVLSALRHWLARPVYRS